MKTMTNKVVARKGNSFSTTKGAARYCETSAGVVTINGMETFVSPAESVRIKVQTTEPWKGLRLFANATMVKAKAIANPIWEQMWMSLLEEETDGGQFEDCLKSLRRLQGAIHKCKLDGDVKAILMDFVWQLANTKKGQRVAFKAFKAYQRARYTA